MSIHTGDDVVNTASWPLEFRQGQKGYADISNTLFLKLYV